MVKLPRLHTLVDFLKRYPVVVRLPVQWGDMDAFKHVNNVVYFKYQESARLKYFQTLVDEIKDPDFDAHAFLHGTGLGPILSETTVKFIFPAVYPDTLLVGATARMLESSSNRFQMMHSVWSLRHNRVLAEGTGTVASFNYAAGQPQDFDPLIVSAIHKVSEKDSSQYEDELSKFV